MTAVEDEISNGLLRWLTEGLAALGLAESDVDYPNTNFAEPIPTPTTMFLRPTVLPADVFAPGVSAGSKNHHVGLFQVSVFQGKGGGEVRPREVRSGIEARFKRLTTIIEGQSRIMILRPPYPLPTIPEEKWVQLPVRVPYVCYAPNPA